MSSCNDASSDGVPSKGEEPPDPEPIGSEAIKFKDGISVLKECIKLSTNDLHWELSTH